MKATQCFTHRSRRLKYYTVSAIVFYMNIRTSVSLPEELLDVIDRRSGQFKNRSRFIEATLRAYLKDGAREDQSERDIRLINRHADRLNREAEDVLAYQVPL